MPGLPHDYARCAGAGWEECEDCQRRTSPWAGLPGGGEHMEPPAIVALWCEAYIPPDRPENQRLRKLAKRQGVER